MSLSERSRELASLRVLGFTRGEISLILLGELAILTCAALPTGAAIGYGLTALLVKSFESEIYRFPLVFSLRVVAFAALVVVAASLRVGTGRPSPARSPGSRRRAETAGVMMLGVLKNRRVLLGVAFVLALVAMAAMAARG